MPGLQPDGSRLPRSPRERVPACRPGTPPPSPPPPPAHGAPRLASCPRGHGALTCREPGSGGAPRWSRGSGQAGGRPAGGRAGRRARESPAPIAELRLLGPLNPRVAGGARPPARPPASGPVAPVGGRSECPRELRPPDRGGCWEEASRAGPDRGSRWGGGGAESPCNPCPALAPPPPWGAPAAATQSRAPGAGGSRGRGRGKFEITPEPPLRPSSTGTASWSPGRVKSPAGITGPNAGLADLRQQRRLVLEPHFPPAPPRPRTQTRTSSSGGPEREALPLQSHSSRVSRLPPPPAARPPGRWGAPASQSPGSGPSN